jgi:hypothetical protein
MNFVADESVDRLIVERLRREGYQVSYVAELEPGMLDEAVLKGLTPARKAEIVALAIKEHLIELPRSFAVIMPGIFRIRRVSAM